MYLCYCRLQGPPYSAKYNLKEEWDEANQPLATVVLEAQSVDEKSNLLCTGIYNILATRFGTKSLRPSGDTNRYRPHNRTLKRLRKAKVQAHRGFHKAQRNWCGQEEIRHLSLIHLRAVREYHKALRQRRKAQHICQARNDWQDCSKQFWRYARTLFDENGSPQHVSPIWKQQPASFKKLIAMSPKISTHLHGYLNPKLQFQSLTSTLTKSKWRKSYML